MFPGKHFLELCPISTASVRHIARKPPSKMNIFLNMQTPPGRSPGARTGPPARRRGGRGRSGRTLPAGVIDGGVAVQQELGDGDQVVAVLAGLIPAPRFGGQCKSRQLAFPAKR